ncbi:oxidoreductase [Pedobacter yulinensis]|uniref:Oxidoreductase n=1 Tax=Pedobacter yulinensis TaxID=2126353 RepID=A0A2T3HKM9_9SPHI|nr:Gfo/Idh/MocA family oxidoreductase [Pedobacter yulinensis]PST82963.1 oxidoreductase [Pedobacter yulinensis]
MKQLFLFFLLLAGLQATARQAPVRVVIAGLSHDHIHLALREYGKGRIDIVGIAEPNVALRKKYAALYKLPDTLFHGSLRELLLRKRPQAVLGYNPVGEHVDLVRMCAPLGISVMVEKPLAATLAQAREMEQLAARYQIKLLTNYETTWYASVKTVYDGVRSGKIGGITRMVAHDGHRGPREIGCSEEFLAWLTDPVLNGAGALNDFGCYGADLMTWLMNGEAPLAVTAVTRTFKPGMYPKVDDDASVQLEYRTATGFIEASWNWPFDIKDLEVFGDKGYYHARDQRQVTSRFGNRQGSTIPAEALSAPFDNPFSYLNAVLNGGINPANSPSSLSYNMTVMRILDAARKAAKEKRRVVLQAR